MATPQDRVKLAKTSVWALDRIESFLPYLNDDDRKYLASKLEEQSGQEQQMKPERAPRGTASPSEE